MKFLATTILFAFIALLGQGSAEPSRNDISVYEKLCQTFGLEKDCWTTANPPTKRPLADIKQETKQNKNLMR
ncbi:AGAP009356-PA [Anopheles gambiae str. PEST]|uniref:AGAP009356-PA n=1 Tax=Anopheles gambiae TaxID=7165 RepID=Q7QGE3_ANOGA|nr:AGAP009356-PA [Anopheles gambiae str. PEST]